MTESNEKQTPREPDEIIDKDLVELARNPAVPVNITDLAALRDRGKEVIVYRNEILETLRRLSIRMTHPSDWLLFKASEDMITGYLQDSGCARIKPLWTIDIKLTSKGDEGAFTKTIDGDEFSYSVTGFGVSTTTQTTSVEHTGIRYSSEDFCKDITIRLKKAAYVKLAALANLEGHIIREMAGLERVPVEELAEAWKGTTKTVERCAKGRGFGSGNTRVGGADDKTELRPDEIPSCPVCNIKLQLRANAKTPFWGCPTYKKHPNRSVIVDHAKLLAEVKANRATTAATDDGSDSAESNTPNTTQGATQGAPGGPEGLISEHEADELLQWAEEAPARKKLVQQVMNDLGYKRRGDIKNKDLQPVYQRVKELENSGK